MAGRNGLAKTVEEFITKMEQTEEDWADFRTLVQDLIKENTDLLQKQRQAEQELEKWKQKHEELSQPKLIPRKSVFCPVKRPSSGRDSSTLSSTSRKRRRIDREVSNSPVFTIPDDSDVDPNWNPSETLSVSSDSDSADVDHMEEEEDGQSVGSRRRSASKGFGSTAVLPESTWRTRVLYGDNAEGDRQCPYCKRYYCGSSGLGSHLWRCEFGPKKPKTTKKSRLERKKLLGLAPPSSGKSGKFVPDRYSDRPCPYCRNIFRGAQGLANHLWRCEQAPENQARNSQKSPSPSPRKSGAPSHDLASFRRRMYEEIVNILDEMDQARS